MTGLIVEDRFVDWFIETRTELKIYSLTGASNRRENLTHVGHVVRSYPDFFSERKGIATIYPVMRGRSGTTMRILDVDEDRPDERIFRAYNAEDGTFLGEGDAGVSDKEMMIFGREAELLQCLRYDVPEWMKRFAWDIGR